MENKKLYRIEKDRVFGGFFGGLGEYFKIDPIILRLIYLFVAALTGFLPGFIAYLVALAIIPKKPN